MENSTPCKYKTVKDIEKPFGIYHFTEIGSPISGGQIGEFLVFFLTHKQILLSPPTGHINMNRIERLNAHNTWFNTRTTTAVILTAGEL